MPLKSQGVAKEITRLRGTINLGIGIQVGTALPGLTVSPQKIADIDNNDATRDTYQRKVFYDGINFFILFWDVTPKQIKYTAGSDGKTWMTPYALWSFSVGPYYGGNVDVQYPRFSGNPTGALCMVFAGSNGNSMDYYPFAISGQTLTKGAGIDVTSFQGQGGSVLANLNGLYDYIIDHRLTGDFRLRIWSAPWTSILLASSDVSHGGTTTGGCQILPYKTTDDYDMFVLAKDASNILYYNLINEGNGQVLSWKLPTFQSIATLGTGFSDWCACSEAQELGDPERVHIVYVKSTGELCYRLFQNDALGSEVILETSGASYPVIAVDSTGRLYVFYVKDGVIKLKRYTGSQWQAAITLFASDHTYNTPVYLSTNQYAQNNQICLVWVEGTSPYELWFCTIPEGY